jgi:hypothetical protein
MAVCTLMLDPNHKSIIMSDGTVTSRILFGKKTKYNVASIIILMIINSLFTVCRGHLKLPKKYQHTKGHKVTMGIMAGLRVANNKSLQEELIYISNLFH